MHLLPAVNSLPGASSLVGEVGCFRLRHNHSESFWGALVVFPTAGASAVRAVGR